VCLLEQARPEHLREARTLGVPQHKLRRRLGNAVVEAAAGSVPILGHLFDMAYRANLRNLAIVDGHFGIAVCR
jgi:hypothetical protein